MPVPGNSPPSTSTPEFLAKSDWASRIHEISKHDDNNVLCKLLDEYKKAGHPKIMTRTWLTMLEGLENVPDRTQEWCQGRADLLLNYIEGGHRLELLHGAIDIIRAKDEKPFVRPEEDEKMYFVIRRLIQGDPELAFHSISGTRPAFMFAASQGADYIVEFALDKLRSLLNRRLGTSKEKLRDVLFDHLKVHDRSLNTALGLAVGEGHSRIVRILLKTEERLAGPEYLRDYHIEDAVGKCQIEILCMVLDAQPDIAERLPGLIVKDRGPRYWEMWTAMAPRFDEFLQNSDILHLAVQKGKLNIIDWLVGRFPQIVTWKDKSGKIALSYNTDEAAKENIRGSIVPNIIRLCSPNEMKELLRVANGGSADRSVGQID